MAVVYVKEQGACLQKRGERVLVSKGGNTLRDLPMIGIENIAVFGNVQITTQLVGCLLERGIDVSYFSAGGRYLGHIGAETSRNIFLRLMQYDHYQNMERRRELARIIVANKIGNQTAVIRGFRWTGEPHDWKADVEQLEKQRSRLDSMETGNQILGLEGFCSNVYFGAYGHMFRCKIRFEGRNRRPPRDPVNVILSLGYTFLTREVSGALEAESFEMYLGFLHGLRYGRKSLALDIVEEFRQPAVDRLTLRLFNKGMLSEYDFEAEDGAVTLNEDGFRKFCREYERWMTDMSYGGGVSFRTRIRQQAAQLKKAIQEHGRYMPFAWRTENVCGQL